MIYTPSVKQTSYTHTRLCFASTYWSTHILGLYKDKDWHTSSGCGPLNLLQICNGTFRAEEKQPGSADSREYKERTDTAWKIGIKNTGQALPQFFNFSRLLGSWYTALQRQGERLFGSHSETSLKRETADKECVYQQEKPIYSLHASHIPSALFTANDGLTLQF